MVTYYHCSICGNMLETIYDSKRVPVCCGQPMELLKPASTDGSREKHVPVYSLNNDELTVTVGETLHPSNPDHFIEWIAVCTNLGYYRRDFHPGDNPTVTFLLPQYEKPLKIYAYCNIHGLWSANSLSKIS